MELIDIIYFYGHIIFFLTFFGFIYLLIIQKKDRDDNHEKREADNDDNYKNNGVKGTFPGNQRGVFVSSVANLRDPVCGMELNEKSNAPLSRYLGHTFHFCSKKCKKLFVIYPNKYVGSL